MRLEDLGFNPELERFMKEIGLGDFEAGRVIAEHRERYIIMAADGEFEAEITGNMRFSAKTREDFPAVGDWVAITTYEPDFAIIHKILPRTSVLKRQAVGKFGEIQIIASNLDCAFLVQAVDRDFNVNRLERYMTICFSSGVTPIIILSKTDLADHDRLTDILEIVKSRIKDVTVITISNVTNNGYEIVNSVIEKGKTYCLLGSSGVGKSTLINNLSGRNLMRTDTISSSTNKGKHVTSHRELIILPNGGILIDTPGMREVGIADSDSGLEITFEHIVNLGKNCKFKDCKHINEAGCAVIESVENGETDQASYENFLKMEREKAYFETTIAEKRRKEKIFGKMIKKYKKLDWK
ncbi:MAG: ribosome small subunit-dependent GTPase A [Saprospiraceae bacterium]|nr:ribosome small subunit-dependent GTPase A [Saprospiraceae bacterium]